MSPNKMLAVAGLFGLVILAVLGAPWRSSETRVAQPSHDGCQVSERDVAELYNTLLIRPEYRNDEAARVRMTAELAHSAEAACREARDRKPTPLPPELQKLAR